MLSFDILAKEKGARAAKVVTLHGAVETPCFVPVGTHAAVTGLSVDDLRNIGSQVIITNAYHLHLRPGENIIGRMGGLHRFMGWDGPLMTDSGGFQIFSLGAGKEDGVGKIAPIFPEGGNRGGHLTSKVGRPLVKIHEDGVDFVSYLDGTSHRFTPERVIEIACILGADITLVLDECTSPFHDYEHTKAAMKRTHRWAIRALEKFNHIPVKGPSLFGIVQGGCYRDLREESAAFIGGQDFDGYAIGGSLGGSKDHMYQVLEWTIPILPEEKPRHLLGIGEIEDIFEIVSRGVDLFDCITPTRMARGGAFFSKSAKRFRIHILNNQFKNDPGPIEETCNCYTCRNYSRAYLRHLYVAKELLAIRLGVIHNLHFLESLMQQIRGAIKENRFSQLMRKWSQK